MIFFRFIFLVSVFFIFSACDNISFTDEDFILSETKSSKEFNPKFSKEETTTLSKNFELSENTVIKNKKVIFNMVKIKTFQHDLTIIADEFISNHSIIQNFEEEQTAKENKKGKSGGHVLIQAKIAKGSLSLILNGENAGAVTRRILSEEEKFELFGMNGRNGRNAVYGKLCEEFTFLFLTNENCQNICLQNAESGENGERGKKGFKGENGKNGGDSGSFYLQAFNLKDFNLTDIKKTVGLGAHGGRGSLGGFGGLGGQSGRDEKNLCKKPLQAKNGERGKSGENGIEGKNGIEETVCLENLKLNFDMPIQKDQEFLTQETKNLKVKSLCDKSFLSAMAKNESVNKNKENILCY